MQRLSLLLSMSLLLACGGAPPTTARVVPSPDLRAEESLPFVRTVREDVARAESDPLTFEHVVTLADAAGPRLAGSAGDALAVRWAVERMTALGFANVHTEPVTVQVWERGAAELSVLAPRTQSIPVAALGGSVGTPAGGIDAEVVRVESLDALADMDRASIEGRIVFVDQRMERARDGHGYGEGVGTRWAAASRTSPLGAVAVIIRSIGTDASRFPHTGMMHYEDGVTPIPAAAISNADADMLGRWIEREQTVRLHLMLGCRDAGEAESANVIGEVVGSEHPEEVVLLGAHLDSWDLGHGAVDDGAGVAIVMEAARQLLHSATPPARTVRVVLFANEENGGAGADAYRAAHGGELAQHVLALESDFGDGAVYGVHTPVDPPDPAPWGRLLSLLEAMGITHDEGEPHGGADVGELGELGVPLVDARQDGTRYFDLHHTANDVVTEVDQESLDQAMRAVLAIASWASRDPDLTR